MRLENHVSLVTGSTKGIGRAIAERFAAEGAKVLVTGRSETEGEQVAEGIRQSGGEARFFRTDVSREQDVVAAVEAACNYWGPLSILVNNAAPMEAVGPQATDNVLVDVDPEDWDHIISVALRGAFLCSKYAVARMQDAGRGSIINISSATATMAQPGLSTYITAKAGLEGMTRSLAVEGSAYGIRSNCIIVGAVPTGSGWDAVLGDPDAVAALRNLQLTRLGTPADIANVALFLASDEAEFVTGASIPAEGGALVKLPLPDARLHREN
ncbi:MAG: SDR family NAD(P)-dependent oxidoreductase [Rhodospirillaceae bacterium]|nr:SDR family NAD(P)-dependent oxidoreductase [Rhodospirillaceae bacterium]